MTLPQANNSLAENGPVIWAAVAPVIPVPGCAIGLSLQPQFNLSAIQHSGGLC